MFTIARSQDSNPGIDVYLPANGFSGVNVPASRPDFDGVDAPRAGEHPVVAQVIGQDQTVTGISTHFGQSAGQTDVLVEAYLMVSAGGTGPFLLPAGCTQLRLTTAEVVSESCVTDPIALNAGDEIALYVHAYTSSTEAKAATFYGSFVITTSTP